MIKKLKFFTLILMMLTISITACRKSDSEMEKALVGTWRWKRCPLSESNNDNQLFWFGEVTFKSNNGFVEKRLEYYCKEDCYTDTFGVNTPVDHCTCSYTVEDGNLIITTTDAEVQGHYGGTDFPYNTAIPIVKVTGQRLVLDEYEQGGIRIECSCYVRN